MSGASCLREEVTRKQDIRAGGSQIQDSISQGGEIHGIRALTKHF